MGSQIVLRGASVWSDDGFSAPMDIVIEDGVIVFIGKRAATDDARIVDVDGCLIIPGLVDLQARVGEPGYEARESLDTLAAAAAWGGFTHVLVMPDTDPPLDGEYGVTHIIARTAESVPHVHVCAAVTRGREGEQLTDFMHLENAGARALGDGTAVRDFHLVRRAMEYGKLSSLPLMVPADDVDVAGGGTVNESAFTTRLGLPGRPGVAEEIGCARLIMLAEAFASQVHVQGISTQRSAQYIERAKEEGARVTAQCSYLHLILTEDYLADYNPAGKVQPPLRQARDVDALTDAVERGIIDAIVVDHAPLTLEESRAEFGQALFGAAGLETALAALHTECILTKRLSWAALIRAMSSKPRSILRLPAGDIVEGAAADLTIFDPAVRWNVDSARWQSRGRNSPFEGRELIGQVRGIVRSSRVAGPLFHA